MADRGSAIGRGIDQERLPWLEPYREAERAGSLPALGGRGTGMAIGGIAAIAAVLTVAYLAGPRDSGSINAPLDVAIAPVSALPDAPAPVAPTPDVSPPIAPAPPLTSEPAPTAIESIAAKALPTMRSPGPPGRVIQLGAFRNAAGANWAYHRRVARYPMLGAMPRTVVPVAAKPSGQILYVLRLGTTSRQQSGVICRNLRASGDQCLVIG